MVQSSIYCASYTRLDPQLWRLTLNSNRIIVSTPQVMLDALRHGYVSMSNDISLIVFDEAHHAVDKHPYNMIMGQFYHTIPDNQLRPAILGLTASPVYSGQIETQFQ